MSSIINTVDRNNLVSLLENKNQNEPNPEMISFANKIPPLEHVEDLKYIDELFYSYFISDKNTKKFACTSAEIFVRRTYSGCSDIGLAIAPILRIKGIPTIYIESAQIEWIIDVQENNEKKEFMRGHIFLEIYINSKWYLYDPTFHLVYDGYNYDNFCLPRNFYVFAKALNCHEFNVYSVSDEKKVGMGVLNNFDTSEYKEPNYEVINLKSLYFDENKNRIIK